MIQDAKCRVMFLDPFIIGDENELGIWLPKVMKFYPSRSWLL